MADLLGGLWTLQRSRGLFWHLPLLVSLLLCWQGTVIFSCKDFLNYILLIFANINKLQQCRHVDTSCYCREYLYVYQNDGVMLLLIAAAHWNIHSSLSSVSFPHLVYGSSVMERLQNPVHACDSSIFLEARSRNGRRGQQSEFQGKDANWDSDKRGWDVLYIHVHSFLVKKKRTCF